ncbi:hypothetical protein pipiens_004046 [Culex pipiens pipiens]|uniref:CCHC-type domain-containing protein n=1 Tax=Culex pipiens pipiens TaxID=38569 RepID=A0ABD1CP09_CULPP
MASNVRKNTVRLVFGPGVKVPLYLEVLKFTMNNLKLFAADMHTIYKDENGGQFYVKLVDEESFAAFIADTDEEYIFKFEDGSTAKVTVEQASRIFRYVRIFNLPLEIEDSAIQYVMGQYGTIRQHVRERFPSEMKVDIFNGVRGVHMEVSKEIPAHLYVGHFRARIFYEGLKNKCFFCKAEGHVKQNCPKLAAIRTGSESSTQPGAAFLGRPVKPVIENGKPMTLEMTTLTPTAITKPITVTSTEQQLTTTEEQSGSTTVPIGTPPAGPKTRPIVAPNAVPNAVLKAVPNATPVATSATAAAEAAEVVQNTSTNDMDAENAWLSSQRHEHESIFAIVVGGKQALQHAHK